MIYWLQSTFDALSTDDNKHIASNSKVSMVGLILL